MPVLRRCPLFSEMADADILFAFADMQSVKRQFRNDQVIMAEGANADRFGIVLEGCAQTEQFDVTGNKYIISDLRPGDIFADSFAFSDAEELSVEIRASGDCRVALIETANFYTCALKRDNLRVVLKNALNAIANANLMLNRRMEILSKRRTRDKLLAFLTMQSRLKDSSTVVVEYGRQELADYLCVDRSGLCVEIGKLCREKIIKCSHNVFTLL